MRVVGWFIAVLIDRLKFEFSAVVLFELKLNFNCHECCLDRMVSKLFSLHYQLLPKSRSFLLSLPTQPLDTYIES